MSEALTAPTAPTERTRWMHVAEKGSILGIRFVIWLATVGGRGPARLVVRLVAAWYTVMHASVRRASAAWWRRILGREPTLGEIYGHVLRFAQTTLDRCFFLLGQGEHFRVTHTGAEHLAGLRAANRGAIILTAHVGSPAAMSVEGRAHKLRMHIVGYFRNAAMINEVMARLDPASLARVVHIEPGNVNSVFAIRERVEAGDLLAIACDRVGINERFVEVDFFGEKAAFPTGPFILAGMLRCPVYIAYALYHEPDRYDLYCEPFADPLDLPRKEREAALQRHVSRYAARMEHYCRLAPDNWFNFFDFWSKH